MVEPRTLTTSFRLSPTEHRMLMDLSELDQRHLGDVLRTLIREAYRQRIEAPKAVRKARK